MFAGREEERALIEKFGIELECESPFEISIPCVSPAFASGHMAEMVMRFLTLLEESKATEDARAFVLAVQDEHGEILEFFKELRQELKEFERQNASN